MRKFTPSALSCCVLMLTSATSHADEESAWYHRLSLRGYTQLRYNSLPSLHHNPSLTNAQADKMIGAGHGFSIRRARLTLLRQDPREGCNSESDRLPVVKVGSFRSLTVAGRRVRFELA